MDKRSRTQSLPVFVPSEELSNLDLNDDSEKDSKEEYNFEADDETSEISSRRPSTVAKEEIDQARRLSAKMSAANRNSSPILLVNSTQLASQSSLKSSDSNESKKSLAGSIYSLGGAVLSFIRGPSESSLSNAKDSNDSLFRSRSKSFSVSNSSKPFRTGYNNAEDESDSNYSDSSEAPDFTLPQNPYSPSLSNTRISVEPGRGKILFKIDDQRTQTCNLIGRDFPSYEHLLSSRDVSTLQLQMPTRWNTYTDWILLYSSRGNGFSLTTLYHQLKSFKGPILIAVKDEFNSIFGAFLNQSLNPRQGHYGNGECFLWRKQGDPSSDAFVKYPSTSKNNYFIISESEYFAVGCGEGKFGLWLEKDLFKGISDPVSTFDNEQLSSNQKFDCISIEIWGLDINEIN